MSEAIKSRLISSRSTFDLGSGRAGDGHEDKSKYSEHLGEKGSSYHSLRTMEVDISVDVDDSWKVLRTRCPIAVKNVLVNPRSSKRVGRFRARAPNSGAGKSSAAV